MLYVYNESMQSNERHCNSIESSVRYIASMNNDNAAYIGSSRMNIIALCPKKASIIVFVA